MQNYIILILWSKILSCPSQPIQSIKVKPISGVVIKQAVYKEGPLQSRPGCTSGPADQIHRYQLMSQSSVVFERQPAAIESISQLR